MKLILENKWMALVNEENVEENKLTTAFAFYVPNKLNHLDYIHLRAKNTTKLH